MCTYIYIYIYTHICIYFFLPIGFTSSPPSSSIQHFARVSLDEGPISDYFPSLSPPFYLWHLAFHHGNLASITKRASSRPSSTTLHPLSHIHPFSLYSFYRIIVRSSATHLSFLPYSKNKSAWTTTFLYRSRSCPGSLFQFPSRRQLTLPFVAPSRAPTPWWVAGRAPRTPSCAGSRRRCPRWGPCRTGPPLRSPPCRETKWWSASAGAARRTPARHPSSLPLHRVAPRRHPVSSSSSPSWSWPTSRRRSPRFAAVGATWLGLFSLFQHSSLLCRTRRFPRKRCFFPPLLVSTSSLDPGESTQGNYAHITRQLGWRLQLIRGAEREREGETRTFPSLRDAVECGVRYKRHATWVTLHASSRCVGEDDDPREYESPWEAIRGPARRDAD